MSARNADALAASVEASLDAAADIMGARWLVDFVFAWLARKYPQLGDGKVKLRFWFITLPFTLNDVRDALLALLARYGIT